MTSRLVVFLPNWVGDAVMATPTLRALRKRFGRGAEIIGIMKPPVAEVLRGTPWLDGVWPYDRLSEDRRHRPIALLARLLRTRLHLSVHLTNDFLTALLARLGGVRERAGYARNRRGWLLTTRLEPLREGGEFVPVSALDYYLDIAYAVGCTAESPRMELATTPEDEAVTERAWERLGLVSEPVVALNSSGAYGAAKLWPEEYCAALAGRIARELGHSVVVLCGPAEREKAARVAAAAGHERVVSLAEQPVSIGLSKAAVKRSRCLVTTDSGPRHFGAAFGVPVVALFGPTHAAWSDTHYDREVRLQVPVDCGPCQQRVCPKPHHKCMRELSVDRVFLAVREALGQ